MTTPRNYHPPISYQRTKRLKPYDRALILLRYNLLAANDLGSSMVFALIFVFVVLTTSLMVSNRGVFGMVGSVFNQDSKLARDAADIGVLRAVMVLNEPENRYLLINANDIDGATGSEISTNKKYLNPCLETSIPNVVQTSFPLKSISGSAYPTIEIDDGVAAKGIQRKFKVISVSQQGLPNADLGTPGGIRITVQGQAVKNGQVIATSTVTRELEVLPKCCGLSLGGPSQAFGADTRQCDTNNPGLGLIAGAYFRNNGKFDTTGGAGITFTTPDGEVIDRVYCLDDNPSNDCSSGGINSGTGTQLVEVTPKLNDVPAIPPLAGGATSCEGSTSTNCDIIINDDIVLSTADFDSWGSTSTTLTCTLQGGNGCTPVTTTSVIFAPISTSTVSTIVDVRQCEGNKLPLGSGCNNSKQTYIAGTIQTLVNFVTNVSIGQSIGVTTPGIATVTVGGNSEIAELKSHCFQNIESGTRVTYCSLDTLKIDPSKSLNIDTSSGPIRFYFPNTSTSISPSIDLGNGNSAIYQTNTLGATKYTDLVFYGIPRSELDSKCPIAIYPTACQYSDFGGGTPASSSFFSYFPGGESNLIGTSTIEGVIWSNIIKATGSPNFVTGSSGVGDVLALIGMDNQTPNNGNATSSILTEPVTRLTKKFLFF